MEILLDQFRLKVGGLHFLVSLVLAFALALPAFFIWFPGDYSRLSGGAHLFFLVIAVDVIVGPILTLLVANERKAKRVLFRDLSVIFLLQMLAFAFGANAMIGARPVALVFEFDQFRVVSASEASAGGLNEAPDSLKGISWLGPKMLAVRRPASLAEQLYEVEGSINGTSLAGLPRFWIPYAPKSNEAWRRGISPSLAKDMHPAQSRKVQELASSEGIGLEEVRVLQLVSRRSSGFVVLAGQSGRVIGVVGPAK
jgi:hypothetical protein